METIIQIDPFCPHFTGLWSIFLLIRVKSGTTGKSQIAYAVARILKLPRLYIGYEFSQRSGAANRNLQYYAMPNPVMMKLFSMAESNLVFIINELDKAASGKGNGNPADVLLTLLDNLGFTDNYMECTVPTFGVYPIATANDKIRVGCPVNVSVLQ